MLDWIAGKIWAALNFIPGLLVDEQSSNYGLTRAILGLWLLILIAFAIPPFWSTIKRWTLKVLALTRK